MNTLHLKILSPFNLIFDADVLSVSSINSAGRFDILPQHANFITLVEGKPIEVRVASEKQKRVFNFPLSVIYTYSNQVSVYTNIGELPKLS